MKARLIPAAVAVLAALAACSTKDMTPVSQECHFRETEERYSIKNIVNPVHFINDLQTMPGEHTSVQTSFDEPTRTHLEINAGGTFSKVLWDAGDEFVMLASEGTGDAMSMYGAWYSTLLGGEKATFTTSGGLPSASRFYSFYPGDISGYADLTDQGLGVTFIANIQSDQTAVAGGVALGANPSVAISATRTENLHFQNIGALLKFRLSGGLVSSINTVSLKGSAPVSGPYAVYFTSDGLVQGTYDFGLDGTSRQVTLTGPFSAGTDYYIVLGPGVQNSFSLVFSGADNAVTKTVTTPVEFVRGHIRDLGTINIGDTFPTYNGPSAELYMAASEGLKPISIAVVPDGFTKTELSDYKTLAKSAINKFFETEPFKSYKTYFNVWILSVASNESGANITDGKGNITTPRDCYFGSKWGADSYGDMNLNETTLYDFVNAYCPDLADRSHTETEVPVLIIINDDRYGGICHSYSNGKAYCQAPVTFGGGLMTWGYPEITAVSDSDPSMGTRPTTEEEMQALGINHGDWRNTVVHEFGGHAFSRLNDEYWYEEDAGAVSRLSEHSWPVPFGLNISVTYSNPLWQSDLLSRRATLVAANPLYERLGVFQGGDVSTLHRWRCEKTSCMIDNRFYFSVWQREIIVRRIMTLAGGTFNLSSFLALDNPIDPVRDAVSSGVMDPKARTTALAPIMPPLPPPVLHF